MNKQTAIYVLERLNREFPVMSARDYWAAVALGFAIGNAVGIALWFSL